MESNSVNKNNNSNDNDNSSSSDKSWRASSPDSHADGGLFATITSPRVAGRSVLAAN